MSPEVLALAAAVTTAAVRELLRWVDRRARRRGEKRTRAEDRKHGAW